MRSRLTWRFLLKLSRPRELQLRKSRVHLIPILSIAKLTTVRTRGLQARRTNSHRRTDTSATSTAPTSDMEDPNAALLLALYNRLTCSSKTQKKRKLRS